jgi:hypothetical protein
VTPMPGVKLQSPIRDLIPIDSSAGPSRDKGKGRAVDQMDEGKSERGRSVTLGARGGVLTQYITNTLQGNGQRT